MNDNFTKSYFKNSLLILILALAFGVRLLYVFHNPVTFDHGIGYDKDSHLYHRIAYNLYSGNGFSVSDSGAAYGEVLSIKDVKHEPQIGRGPVYPLFIAFIYKVFCDPKDMESIDTWHRNWDKVRIAQSLMDALVCLLVFFIVRSVIPKSFWPAIVASFLYAFNPFTIVFVKMIMREALTASVLTTAIFLYIKALQKKDTCRWILAGTGFGLLILSRPEYIFSLFVLAAYAIFVDRHVFSHATKKALIFIVCSMIVVFPWTLRNYMVFEKPIMISVGGRGYGLFTGTFFTPKNWTWAGFPEEVYKDAQDKERIEALRMDYTKAMISGTMDIKKYDDIFFTLALERIREDPRNAIRTWITRIPYLWYHNYRVDNPKEWSFFLNNPFIFYLLLALYAFFSGDGREKAMTGVVLLLVIYLTVLLLPIAIVPRYSVPLIPVVITLAGIGLWRILLLLKRRFNRASLLLP